MRPVQIIDNPPLHPHVCCACGSGPTSREHFVDLGLDTTLEEIDQYQTRHIKDAVIYLCDQCMANLISRYVTLMSEFIRRQGEGVKLHNLQGNKTVEIQAKEIAHMRNQILVLEAKLLEKEKTTTSQEPEQSALDVLKGIVGDLDVNRIGANDSSASADDSNATGSDSDAIRADQGSDGDSSADESLGTSDLFDLRAGNITAPRSNK